MIDDMMGLYSHASDALRAGEISGRQKFYDAVKDALQQISLSQEKIPEDGSSEGKLATRGFHIAQECCGAVMKIKLEMDAAKRTLV